MPEKIPSRPDIATSREAVTMLERRTKYFTKPASRWLAAAAVLLANEGCASFQYAASAAAPALDLEGNAARVELAPQFVPGLSPTQGVDKKAGIQFQAALRVSTWPELRGDHAWWEMGDGYFDARYWTDHADEIRAERLRLPRGFFMPPKDGPRPTETVAIIHGRPDETENAAYARGLGVILSRVPVDSGIRVIRHASQDATGAASIALRFAEYVGPIPAMAERARDGEVTEAEGLHVLVLRGAVPELAEAMKRREELEARVPYARRIRELESELKTAPPDQRDALETDLAAYHDALDAWKSTAAEGTHAGRGAWKLARPKQEYADWQAAVADVQEILQEVRRRGFGQALTALAPDRGLEQRLQMVVDEAEHRVMIVASADEHLKADYYAR